MRVNFQYGLGTDQKTEEWGLDSPPVQGDGVYIAQKMWEVRQVNWILTASNGDPLRQIYVDVILS